jgi:prepilin-type N-terminal cleavage/methylation domain-containing protein
MGNRGAPAGARWALLERVSDMTRLRRALLRGLRAEGGFTLAELLVAMMITLIAFAAALLLLQVALKAQPRISERGAAIQQGRAWIERLTRELRQGGTVTGSPTSSQLAFLTFVRHSACGGTATGNSIQCLVTYSCAAGTCSRTERNPDGSGTAAAQQMVTGLQSNSVFTYTPSTAAPEYVGVTLMFPATDDPGETEDAITLTDGVTLRNFPG